MMQTRTMSMVEAVVNVVVGYILAVLTQFVVFPMFGLNATLAQNLKLGLAFMLVSLTRDYLLRRLFERIRA